MKKSTYTLISLLLLVGMYCAASVSYALDAPHNPVGGVDCDLCHYPAGTTPDWTSVPSSTVTTPLNALCATCHRDTNLAVMGEKFAFVKTHSSFETILRHRDQTFTSLNAAPAITRICRIR